MRLTQSLIPAGIALAFMVLYQNCGFVLGDGQFEVQDQQGLNTSSSTLGASTVFSGSSQGNILGPFDEQDMGTSQPIGNRYSPEVLYDNGIYRMWYGAQNKWGRDQIHHAYSADGVHWTKDRVVLPHGKYLHVNDPSVVKVNGTYYIYFSAPPPSDGRDTINVATSQDGLNWTDRGVAISYTSNGDWRSCAVARPTVMVENGVFKMWFDSQRGSRLSNPGCASKDWAPQVGYATSTDGINFSVFDKPGTGTVNDSFADVDVRKVNGVYLMLGEHPQGFFQSTSVDGINWSPWNLRWARGSFPNVDDTYVDISPNLFFDPVNSRYNLYFAGGRNAAWTAQDIAMVSGIDMSDIKGPAAAGNPTLRLNTAESNESLSGWSPNGAINPALGQVYSSQSFSQSSNSRGVYLAAWFQSSKNVSELVIKARKVGGSAVAFPKRYKVYLTDSTNTNWVLAAHSHQQPDSTGQVRLALGSRTTWGVMIVPEELGVDNEGNYYFQIADLYFVF